MADSRATFSFSGDPSGSLFDPPDYFSGQFNSYKADPRADGRYQRASESGIAARQEDQRKIDEMKSNRENESKTGWGALSLAPPNFQTNDELNSLFNSPKKKSAVAPQPQRSKYWDLLQRLLREEY